MHILHEGVKRGVAEKLVHEALATWDEEKKRTFPLFGKTKDSYVFEKQRIHRYCATNSWSLLSLPNSKFCVFLN